MHYKSSWACVTHISQESENNGIFVGWPLLVSLVENPQNGVEWFRPVSLFEMNQRNVALCLETFALCPGVCSAEHALVDIMT